MGIIRVAGLFKAAVQEEDLRSEPGQKGQTLVEFALVFPILLLFVLAIIQLALVYSAKIILNYAAFSAARSFIVYQEHKKAEMAARLICLPISSRPTNMIESALGIDLPGLDSFGALGEAQGIAERYLYSSYATNVRLFDSSGSPLDEGRVLEPGKDDATVEVSHKFRLTLPIVNRLIGKSMAGEKLGKFFDFGLYYIPLSSRATLTVEDTPAPSEEGPCFGNVSLGCCFTKDEVMFVQCRGIPSCKSPECCTERNRRAWRVRSEVLKRKGLGEKGSIVKEMLCKPTI